MLTRGEFLSSLGASVACAALPGCKTAGRDDPTVTKVLMIGNDLSITCLRHLPAIAKELDIKLDLASLYLRDGSLKKLWENAGPWPGKSEDSPFLLERNRCGDYSKEKANLNETLAETKWNYVTLQQTDEEAWRVASYVNEGPKLVARIRAIAPQASLYVQETWGTTPWDDRLADWKLSPDEMYAKIHAACAFFARKNDLKVIPFGTAVQAWREDLPVKYKVNSFGGDVVGGRNQKPEDAFKRTMTNGWVPNSDVTHLNEKGEYFQALVWAKCLLKTDLKKLKYRPDFVTEDEGKLMKKIARSLT